MSAEKYQNYQWQITDYGLETRENNDDYFTEYSIPASDLYELITIEEGVFFRSLLPLLGREWVIGDDLIEIYPKALEFHAAILGQTIDELQVKTALEVFKSNDTWLKAKEIRKRF